MSFLNERKLVNYMSYLKNRYSLVGIKAEFEAEGSSHNDIFLLRALTNKANTKLFVKIGGVEAINDIKFLLNINVDGIIAAMVESRFAASKFLSFINKSNLINKPNLTINIVSKNAVENIYEIYSVIKNQINDITIGRTDLAASYFNNNILPNSNFITKKIIEISKVFKKNNKKILVAISAKSLRSQFNFENFSFDYIKEFIFKDISIVQYAYAGELKYYLKKKTKNYIG